MESIWGKRASTATCLILAWSHRPKRRLGSLVLFVSGQAARCFNFTWAFQRKNIFVSGAVARLCRKIDLLRFRIV